MQGLDISYMESNSQREQFCPKSFGITPEQKPQKQDVRTKNNATKTSITLFIIKAVWSDFLLLQYQIIFNSNHLSWKVKDFQIFTSAKSVSLQR